MGKTTAPLLSFGASGKLADTIVYSKWKGRPYARRYTIPANPQSTEQTVTRSLFGWLSGVWKIAPALFTAPYTLYAQGKVLTNRNAFVKFNLPDLRSQVDLANMVFSPGALGGLPPTAVVVTPGVGQLSIAITEPTVVPAGWTIASAVAAAIADQDPQTELLYEITAGEDVATPFTVDLTGLDTVLYRVGAWLKWTRPDGSVAYSPSVQSSGTPT